MELTLSEAIKKGAKLRPQAYGRFRKTSRPIYRRGKPPKVVSATCALGAAKEAAGVRAIGLSMRDALYIRFPLLEDVVETMPCGCSAENSRYGPWTVRAAIFHLNDTHRWRRETIAQWVKTLEEGK